MKLVVGLGNPGSRYRRTRHNLGFMVIDRLAERWAIDVTRERMNAWIGNGRFGEHAVVLAKPTTFMNRSGSAVQAIGHFYRLQRTDLLVVTDDLALPLGKLRLRAQGSAGGHNGLADIIERLGTQDFARLRVGIDSPTYGATDHVLGEFDPADAAVVQAAVDRAADAVACWIEYGVEAAMNRFNSEPPTGQSREGQASDGGS